jgi:hypothetical protein
MKDIKVGPTAQLAVLGVLALALLAAIGASLPELRRYLNIRSM